MNISKASKILGLSGAFAFSDVKIAYRKACSKYHPDKNPSGEEMMKEINKAYELLKEHKSSYEEKYKNKNTSREDSETNGNYSTENESYEVAFGNAIRFLKTLKGVTIEIFGNWIWLYGNTKAYKDELKEYKKNSVDGNGFRWAPKKQCWYFKPNNWKKTHKGAWSMDAIRNRHGSQKINAESGKLSRNGRYPSYSA